MKEEAPLSGPTFAQVEIWFKLKCRIGERITVRREAPDFLKKLVIPDAHITYTYGDFGYIFSQKLLVLDYAIWSHRLFMGRPQRAFPITNSNLATLNYTLNGLVDCYLADFGEVQLQPLKYQMYALPAGGLNRADFVPGNYEFFHIGFPNSAFQYIRNRQPQFNKLVELINKDFRGATFIDLLPFTKSISREIDKVLNYKKSMAAGPFYVLESIIRLLNIFLEDIDISAPPRANKAHGANRRRTGSIYKRQPSAPGPAWR